MCLIWKCCEQKEFWLTVRRQTLGTSARPQREHLIENSYSPAIQKTKVNLPQTGNFPWLCLITTITTPKRNLRAELFQVHPDVDLPISGFPPHETIHFRNQASSSSCDPLIRDAQIIPQRMTKKGEIDVITSNPMVFLDLPREATGQPENSLPRSQRSTQQ